MGPDVPGQPFPGRCWIGAALAVAIGLLAACTSNGPSTRNPTAYVEGATYAPVVDPATFSSPKPNPTFPLVPGTRTVFEGGGEHVEIVVTSDTKAIMGVTATVITDQVFTNGELAEDTLDWYAADNDGNVWYLGEQTAEYENGAVTTTAGSWEAGVNGALPGIVMLADPQLDDVYRQEYLAGEAEDLAKIHAVGESRTVPAGSYTDILVTEEWTPLEPDVIERKWYAPGVGVVYEETVSGGSGTLSLTEFSTPPVQ